MKYTVKATFNGEEMTMETDDLEEANIMVEQAFDAGEEDVLVDDISLVDENGNDAMSQEMKDYMGVE